MRQSTKAPRIALDSLGCKLNQAEIEHLARELTEAGYCLVAPDDEADIYVLNTCSVTSIADAKSRHRLRLAHQRNPQARLVATGCYAQRAPQELAHIDGVSLVIGNNEKSRLLRLLESIDYLNPEADQKDSIDNHHHHFKTRAFIKIQDGCNNFCTYCIVPLVRGREASLPADPIVEEVRQMAADGYQEAVLTGTRVGSYESIGTNLRQLIERILAETEISRLRLSSLQPQEISPELIGLWRDRRLCRHFHLSLQSGCGDVLSRMGRRYSTAEYRRTVASIREVAPETAITTDVIVGFPGETDREFQESYDFCRQMDFARIHVFPYSPRQGTAAARLPGKVNNQVKKERSQQMLSLAKESASKFYQRFLNQTMPVLWEKQNHGIWSGHTDNYITVYTESDRDLTNRVMPTKLRKIRGDGIWGEIIEERDEQS